MRWVGGRPPQPRAAPELVAYLVQAKAIDQLHHVVVQPDLVANPEYGDDIRVVQWRCRLRLAIETLDLSGTVQYIDGQHLERDAAG